MFQVLPGNRPFVVATQFVFVFGASIPLFGHDGVGAATHCAFQPPAEQVFGALRCVKRIGLCFAVGRGDRVLSFFDTEPEVQGDNLEFLILDLDPFIFVVQTCFAGLGLRVLRECLPVPDDPSEVQFVVDDAGAALLVTANSRVPPKVTSWSWNTFIIEFLGDLAGRPAAGKVLKDPQDDLGFFRHDLAVSRDPVSVCITDLLDFVAVGKPARAFALCDGVLHAVSGFGRCLLQIIFRDRCPNTELQRVDFARLAGV
ncbi:MAG: hypothetical protein ABJQ21_06165 [Roseibium sp.]